MGTSPHRAARSMRFPQVRVASPACGLTGCRPGLTMRRMSSIRFRRSPADQRKTTIPAVALKILGEQALPQLGKPTLRRRGHMRFRRQSNRRLPYASRILLGRVSDRCAPVRLTPSLKPKIPNTTPATSTAKSTRAKSFLLSIARALLTVKFTATVLISRSPTSLTQADPVHHPSSRGRDTRLSVG